MWGVCTGTREPSLFLSLTQLEENM
jgi:hypothetical protein